MEYSVYDLIRILVRKWYVVLLTMCLLGGAAIFVARQSYQRALEDYETHTTQTIAAPQETGTLIAVYQLSYAPTDMTKYINQAKTKDAFFQEYFMNAYGESYHQTQMSDAEAAAESAFASASAALSKLLTDSVVRQTAQSVVDSIGILEPPVISPDGTATPGGTPLVLKSHLMVKQLDPSTLRVTVSGLDQASARTVLDAYWQGVQEVGKEAYSMEVSATQTSNNYLTQPDQFTNSALLSQVVMKKPEQAPVFVKTVGTAAAFGFVLACFGVLLVTFIRDTRIQIKKQSAAQEPNA